MTKKANIIKVEKNGKNFKATYESGASRSYKAESLPGTVRAWIEAKAPELLEPVIEEPMTEQATESIGEPEPMPTETTEEPTIEEQTTEEQTTEEPTTEEPTIEEPTIEEPTIEETALVIIEEAEEATAGEAPRTAGPDIIDAAVAVATAVIRIGQAVAPILGQAAQAAPTVAMWTADQLTAIWFVLSTYLPLWASKAWAVTTLLVIPRAMRQGCKAARAVRAAVPGALRVAGVVAGGALGGSLMAAGAIWSAAKATMKAGRAVAREAKAGWELKKELDSEWEAA